MTIEECAFCEHSTEYTVDGDCSECIKEGNHCEDHGSHTRDPEDESK